MKSSAEQNLPKYYQHAGFWVRLIAFIIDTLVLYVFALIIQSFFSYISLAWIILFELLVFPAFNLLLLAKYGTTVGKWVMKLKVLDANFRRPHFFQLLLRETLGKYISDLFFFAGYIWIIFDDKMQAWHDKVAKTYVVYSKPISQEKYIESQKIKKRLLPVFLLIFGFLEPIFNYFVLWWLSHLVLLYRPLYELQYVFVVLILISALAQVVYGFVMIIWQKKREMLSEQQKIIGFILLVFGLLTVIAIPSMILSTHVVVSNLTLKSSSGYQIRDIYTGRFTMQYPSDWVVDTSGWARSNVGRHLLQNVEIKGKEGSISILWGKGFWELCSTSYDEKIKLGNQEFKACHFLRLDQFRQFDEWNLSGVKHKDLYYSGSVRVNSPYEINKPVVFKILSTFRFTGENQTIDISNWNTYANPKFTFKYPDDRFIISERFRNYLVLNLIGGMSGSEGGIHIDASIHKLDYDSSIEKQNKALIDPSMHIIKNGIKISGKYGRPEALGMPSEGTEILVAYLKYKDDFVVVRSTDMNVFIYFDQIVSTFKFPN